MSCFLWIFRFQLIELPITAFAGIYLAWEIVVAMFTGFSMSSGDVATCRLGDRGGSRGGNVETELG